MNDIEEIKRRMAKRQSKRGQPLTENHFRILYNFFTKCMVIFLCALAVLSYIKISPNGEYLSKFVFNDFKLNQVTNWLNHTLLSWQENMNNEINVSSKVDYTQIQDNYYSNSSNEVLNFEKGRVIYVGNQEMLGNYIIVMLENNVEVTYGLMDDVFVNLYDQVDKSTILGTYHDKVLLVFTKDNHELDYSSFEELLSSS